VLAVPRADRAFGRRARRDGARRPRLLRVIQRLSATDITEFLNEVFPGAMESFVIEDVQAMSARVRMPFSQYRLRPGGTISGPSLMTLADTGVWIALRAMIGREPLSVTSHLSIDFLRKPEQRDLIGFATIHKIGKKLAVGDVLMYSEGEEAPCGRASVTYAIPSVRLDPDVD